MQSTETGSSPIGTPAPTEPLERHGDEARLGGGWLALARWVGVALAATTLALDAIAIPVMYHVAQRVCSGAACNAQLTSSVLLTPAQASQLHALGLSLGFYAAYMVGLYTFATAVYTAPAVLIFWRRPDDPMALFAASMLVVFGGAAFNGTMQALPLVNPAWTFPTLLLNAIGQVALYVFFCVFPSGRFAPRWMRWAALGYALAWAFQLAQVGPLAALGQYLTNGPWFIGTIALLIVAQVYRYRQVSTRAERQAAKWVVYGVAVGASGFLLVLIINNFVLAPDLSSHILGQIIFITIVYLFLLCIPVAIAVAILRSRLWDIDILIQRTLVYGLVTVVLAGIYFAVVVSAQAVVQALTGQGGQQPVFIVASTLLIAALFTPVRQRIQGTVDRRFYRRKYDAARTLAAFGATLRTETDLDQLSAQLVGVVRQTMQPEQLSIWLRPTDRSASDPAARWNPREQDE